MTQWEETSAFIHNTKRVCLESESYYTIRAWRGDREQITYSVSLCLSLSHIKSSLVPPWAGRNDCINKKQKFLPHIFPNVCMHVRTHVYVHVFMHILPFYCEISREYSRHTIQIGGNIGTKSLQHTWRGQWYFRGIVRAKFSQIRARCRWGGERPLSAFFPRI